MTAKKSLDALERSPRGRDGQLLTHDLKQERAVQVHRWKIVEPRVGLEVGVALDEAPDDWIHLAEVLPGFPKLR